MHRTIITAALIIATAILAATLLQPRMQAINNVTAWVSVGGFVAVCQRTAEFEVRCSNWD